MNCLYITLFFNIVAGIVQTFIKSWNQLLYPRVIEVCRLSEIINGLPLLCSSWTSVLPSENSQNHFVTFYLFITLRYTATICLWISAVHLPFALRNRMTERTSHLAGLWIVAAISNTSHSKPVLLLSSEHGSQTKDQGRRQCCQNNNKNFPIGLHVRYLYFLYTPRIWAPSFWTQRTLRVYVWGPSGTSAK
jgi:hypothetical protein